MLIDLDNGAKLERKGDAPVDVTELVHRTVSDTFLHPFEQSNRSSGHSKVQRSVGVSGQGPLRQWRILDHSDARTVRRSQELVHQGVWEG